MATRHAAESSLTSSALCGHFHHGMGADTQNNHDWNKVISYVFSAFSGKEVGTNYTENENIDGFKPIWMALDTFIIEKEKIKDKDKNYSGYFSDKRDLEIAKFFKAKLLGI